jgi:anti-sigma factor RsiW
MADCRDLEELLAPYVDGEARAVDCAAIDAHLRTCPACRTKVSCERTVREALIARRERIRPSAPPDLRRRCAAAHAAAAPGSAASLPAGAGRRRGSWVPLSMAASILLAFAGVFFYGLRGGGPALAAQLVADHVSCFEIAPQPTVIPDGRALGREWAATRGWNLKVPENTDTEQLTLLDIRRCISSDAVTAHLLYKWRGQPLSVYVMSRPYPRIGPKPQLVEEAGQEAFMWTKNDRTYAVVARGRPADVEHVARYVQTTAE